MKKTLLILPIVIIVVFVTLIGNYTVSPYAFAKDKHHNNFSSSTTQFSGINYDAMYESNQYVDSFTPLPLSSKMADILTASFTNIIDTQINTGMKTN